MSHQTHEAAEKLLSPTVKAQAEAMKQYITKMSMLMGLKVSKVLQDVVDDVIQTQTCQPTIRMKNWSSSEN